MFLPMLFTSGMCDVTYIRVYNTYLHGRCFLSVLYNDIICLASTQSTCLFVSSDSSSHAVRSSSLCTDRHTAVFACAANTRNTAVGLGLPLEMPLGVKFSCCEWTINSRTRISLKFLFVILLPHDLCIRNAFRMVMSVRWKTVSWSTSMFCGQFHSCWPFCLTCPQTPYRHCSLLQHEVW